MSEQAQGETKWRLGERARVRVHHGHASVVSLRRQKKMAHDFDLRRAEDPQARVDDFVQQPFGQVFFFFFVAITVSVDGKDA